MNLFSLKKATLITLFSSVRVIPTLVVLLFLSGCEEFTEESLLRSGRVVEGTYKNEILGLTVNLPDGWSPVPQSQSKEWKQAGDPMIADKGQIVNETTLFSYWDKGSGMITLNCVEKKHFIQLKNEKEYAQNIRSVLTKVLQEQGISFLDNLSDTSINGKSFSKLEMKYIGPNGKVVFVQDFYFKYLNYLILTIRLGYDENSDRETLYSSLNSLIFDTGL